MLRAPAKINIASARRAYSSYSIAIAVMLRYQPGGVRANSRAVPAVLASAHEQSVPIFQQLVRGHPPGRDDVRAIPAVAAQRRGSVGRARDRHQPRDNQERLSSRGKSTSRDALLPWPSGALSRHRPPLARWRSSRMSTNLRYFDSAVERLTTDEEPDAAPST